MPPFLLRCGRFEIDLTHPRIMGIVNLTDSLSGDGLGADTARAIAHGRRLVEEGADMLDIGGESSRPGALPISQEQELARVLPVLEGLRDCGVPLSIDTLKPAVIQAALAAGADMINDITALQNPGALEAVAASQCAVCLMHMQGNPRTMQAAPHYADVVAEVGAFLESRVLVANAAGIEPERLLLDPGFGFGKTLAHNLALLRQLDQLRIRNLPLLVGLSRKSMLGQLTGRPPEARMPATLAASLLALQRGASIVRVHDVAAMRDAITLLESVETQQ